MVGCVAILIVSIFIKSSYTKECADTSSYATSCPKWKKNNLCKLESKYYPFMKKNCMKTCEFCKEENTKTEVGSNACSDTTKYASKCSRWKTSGLCASDHKHFKFMKINCNETCGFCKDTTKYIKESNACSDITKYASRCSGWKTSGLCASDHNYFKFMKINCNETCGFCKDTTKYIKGSNACSDTTKYASRCSGWKTSGLCASDHKHFKFMKINCNETCGFCKDTTKHKNCMDSDKYVGKCKSLKALGYCEKEHLFHNSMNIFCRKTCNLCQNTGVSECAKGPSDKKRVVGGKEAVANSWPWQVGILSDSKMHCGGTLISPSWVLTAAHCVIDRSLEEFDAYLGQHSWKNQTGDEQKRKISKIIIYPNYNLLDNKNDIALMKLDRHVTINDKVNYACIPEQSDAETSVGDLCYITGWGKTGLDDAPSDTLQEAPLPVVMNKQCEKLNIKRGSGLKLEKGMLCAGFGGDYSKEQSGCRGDSGGPFACKTGIKWTVEGIVSWGSSKCYGFEKYTVFTRISSYRNWIDKNID